MADIMYVKETKVLNKDDTYTAPGLAGAWNRIRVCNLDTDATAEISVVHAGADSGDAWSLSLGKYGGDVSDLWLYLQSGGVITGVEGEAHVVVLQ